MMLNNEYEKERVWRILTVDCSKQNESVQILFSKNITAVLAR